LLCEICQKEEFFVKCQGCGIAMCEKCYKFDLFGHGCGCVVPVYMCPICINDPHLNPYTTGEM